MGHPANACGTTSRELPPKKLCRRFDQEDHQPLNARPGELAPDVVSLTSNKNLETSCSPAALPKPATWFPMNRNASSLPAVARLCPRDAQGGAG